MFMSNERKKPLIKKQGGEIEFCLGDAGPTKYEIMTAIAKEYTVYGATVWLNTPLPEHENKTPAKLMLEGELDLVAQIVEEFKDESKHK